MIGEMDEPKITVLDQANAIWKRLINIVNICSLPTPASSMKDTSRWGIMELN